MQPGMSVGIAMFPTCDAIDPATPAREVEGRGFESLYFPERTHTPVSRATPYPCGITRVLFLLSAAGLDEVLPQLDRLAETHLSG